MADDRNEFERIDVEYSSDKQAAERPADNGISGEYHLSGSDIPRSDDTAGFGRTAPAGGDEARRAYSAQGAGANAPYYGSAAPGFNAQPPHGPAGGQSGRASGPVPPTGPVYSHMFSDGTQPPLKKKRGGRVSVATVAVSVVLSLAAGFGGTLLANRVFPPKAGQNTVMYQSVDRTGVETEVKGVSDIVDMTQRSVVEITTEALSTGSFFNQYITSGAGSGIILTADGYIVTNNHVVSGKSSITVTVGETKYNARVVGTDSTSDLAVIKIDAEGLTPAVLGDSSSVKVGDSVIVIGNPLGSLGGSVTDGIVSALERSVSIDGKQMTLLQTNAEINPGNSGGGMFNMYGELIGIVNSKSSLTSAGTTVEGIGFAIPVDTVKEVTAEIMEKGFVSGGPAMGVQIIQISSQSAAQQYGVSRLGVYVASVEEGMGAEAAGLMPGDYIMSINDKLVETTADITELISTLEAGDRVTLQIVRGSDLLTVEVELSERTQ